MLRFIARLLVARLLLGRAEARVSVSKLTKVTTLSSWLLAVSMASLYL